MDIVQKINQFFEYKEEIENEIWRIFKIGGIAQCEKIISFSIDNYKLKIEYTIYFFDYVMEKEIPLGLFNANSEDIISFFNKSK